MLSKIEIVLITAVLLGSASSAFAIDPDGFDVDLYRPTATATAAHTTQVPRGFVQAPVRLGGGSVMQAPFAAGEQSIMDRASRSWW
jgi:hypothetical protein